MAHRGSVTPLQSISHRSPLNLRTTISRDRHRSLWWWSRQRNDWSSSFDLDEGLEERIRRHQRIMKHRYSKALRRRELWDADTNCRSTPSWPWRLPGRWLGGQVTDMHNLSSSSDPRANVEGQDNNQVNNRQPSGSSNRDFNAVKQSIDQLVDRDPYGAIFGRRIQSPPSANNSSWTSFSWIFTSKEIKESSDKQGSDLTSPTSPKSTTNASQTDESATSNSVASSNAIPRSQSIFDDEYEYDPISMRKVPKAKPVEKPSEPPQRSTLFETFFSEHGATIPVKTYKPPKVYGYSAAPKTVKESAEKSVTSKNGFENSRKRELQTLMSATLGNTIDTTAEYGGKYKTGEEIAVETSPSIRSRDTPEPAEDAPLFSGTTYQDKSELIINAARPKSEWLRKEGFKSDGEGNPTASQDSNEAANIPIKKFNAKIESSLDRMSSRPKESRQAALSKLEPALDRQSRPREGKAITGSTADEPNEMQKETAEDIDLLRASDVRAATKSARVSKQEVERSKQEVRDKLEVDYISRLKDPNETAGYPENFTTAKEKLAKSMTNVWKHVKQYPDGIVAKTMRTMGFNENFKKYIRPDKPAIDSTQKLIFKDASLSNVSSIYKPPVRRPAIPINTFTPSTQALSVEIQEAERNAALQRTADEAKKEAKIELAKVSALATDIKSAYEIGYGKIDFNHRQPQQTTTNAIEAGSEYLHPLETASVKEGVPRYPVVENHVYNFEPKYAALVDGVKKIRRELHDAKNHYKALKLRRTQPLWSMGEAAGHQIPTEVMHPEQSQSENLDSSVVATAVAETEATSPKEEIISKTSKLPKLQDPVFTPAESPAWNDEQPPPMAELKKSVFNSTYVILVYNSNTGKVEISPMNMPAADQSTSELANPLKILSRLSNASEYLKHFPQLEEANYELVSGSGDMLIFKKHTTSVSATDRNMADTEKRDILRNKIAAEEAAAQPAPKEAATVLDQIPNDIEPSPGPAAPTDPPSSSPSPVSRPASSPKVRRQEEVFSGTLRPNPIATPSPTASSMSTPGPYPSSSSTSPLSQSEPWVSNEPANQSRVIFNDQPQPQRPSFFRRFTRAVRRVLLTAVAIGGGAYAIGVLAEGVEARAQVSDGEKGPRKRIVMNGAGQRPGIYSTESSR